jgi:tetrahydromethanopterin S-methyltransferase subunit B
MSYRDYQLFLNEQMVREFMPIETELIIIAILILTCFVTAFITGYNARAIRREIEETKARVLTLKKERTENHASEIKKLEGTVRKLETELEEVEKSILFSTSSENAPLSEKIRSSASYIVMIIVGVIIGAVFIVLVPAILLVVLFTLATFVGSTGLLLEIIRNQRKVLALSTIPAALYLLTQIFNMMNLFDLVFWLFDLVVVFALIGVAMIIGKDLPIEIAILILGILSIWDIYAVFLSRIMVTAVVTLEHTVFSVQIPTETGYSLIGGGDLFFSYLLVTTFTRRLKQIPLALVGLIAVTLTGLTAIMYVTGLGFAPALPPVLIAALLSMAFYHNRFGKSS